MDLELRYVTASEQELTDLTHGRLAGYPTAWPSSFSRPRFRLGETGVLLRSGPKSYIDRVQPVSLVVHAGDARRLFGRYAQLRSDLSPLSAWCHILSPDQFEKLDRPDRQPSFDGFEAAWIGLAIAEALLLAERSIGKLKIAACLATQTYTIARTLGLWSMPVGEVLSKYDATQLIVRKTETSVSRLRARLEPIWAALASVSFGSPPVSNGASMLVECLQTLQQARLNDDSAEAELLHRALSNLPQSELLLRLSRLTPELRVREFDNLVGALEGDTATRAHSHQHQLLFLAGYLATIVAGGAPSLSLAENVAQRWPEITAWAYVIGSVGERVVWTSSFDGLGRLVARELMRPFRVDEAPTCDFCLDEALAIVDKQLADPLVHLKIKQLRLVTVGIAPGVNIPVTFADLVDDAKRSDRPGSKLHDALPGRRVQEVLAELADALWPHIKSRVAQGTTETSSFEERKSRSKKPKRFGGQTKLPLNR